MQKFGFRIRTRSGTTVEHLVIQGREQADAETKLRQMYLQCTILECKIIDEVARGDGTDLEGAIGLIVGRDRPG